MRLRGWAIALAAVAALSGCGADQPELVASVTGVVERGPTCPVEAEDAPCPPAPAAGVTVEIRQHGEVVVTSTTTDADGRFDLAAPAGVVEVVASSSEGLPSEDIETLTLDPGDDVEVELILDSGIR
jgi:hypothetical protein